jgi:MFS family permease
VFPAGAAYAVTVLTVMNLLNYVDRYVPSAIKDLFKKDLGLTDAETSLPLTAFIFVYMFACPLFGSMSDRWPRRVVIAAAGALWSLATAAGALAWDFWSFLVARALVGIGEAAYATLAPALISDFFPPEKRNRIFTVFFVAIPIGVAVGFQVGAVVGEKFGWRWALTACGLPGMLAAVTALFIREPRRGAFDVDRDLSSPPWPEALKQLARNREYVLTVAGYTLVNFASGALVDWFPTYLQRVRGLGIAEAGDVMAPAIVLGGLAGTAVGGGLADKLMGRIRHPYLAVSALSMGVAGVLTVFGILAQSKMAITILIVLTQFFMWFYNGPINTVLVNCVNSALRTRAFSFSILVIHILGDAISPPLVGFIADSTDNLTLGISIVPLTLLMGTAVWIYAWRTLPEQRAESASVVV